MYEEHPVFESPDDQDAKLWRYMDFTKFVNILNNNSLFFTRADKFRDKFEGSYPSLNRIVAPQVYPDFTEEELEKFLGSTEKFNKVLRELTLINCWHMNEYQSAAMWDLYIKTNEGIAIQTTFKRLKESFHKTKTPIQIGKVHYIDFDTEWMPEGNAFYPFVHKRKSFEHEREIRAIQMNFPDADNPTSFAFGDNINVDVDILIEKVYVSPDAPTWFSQLVEEVMRKYEIYKPVIHSDLYNIPK